MRSQFKHNCLSNLETNVKEIFDLVNITKKKKKKIRLKVLGNWKILLNKLFNQKKLIIIKKDGGRKTN